MEVNKYTNHMQRTYNKGNKMRAHVGVRVCCHKYLMHENVIDKMLLAFLDIGLSKYSPRTKYSSSGW